MITRAAVLSKLKSSLELLELEIPELKEGQVLVKILYSGICHSQLNEINGLKGEDKFLPHTLGHEASGTVQRTGKGVTKVKPGDYVVLSWIKGNGMDSPFATYNSGSRKINSGAVSTFMEHAVVSENRLVKISEKLPSDVAALFGCTIPTAAGIISNTLKPKSGSSIAIFGAGGIGLAALLFAKAYGCNPVIVVDINEAKLRVARKLGAASVINAAKDDVVGKIREVVGSGVDYAIESSGAKQAMEQAYCAIKDNGTLVIAGNLEKGEKISLDPFDLIKGKRIIGTWGGETLPDDDIPRYVNMFLEGNFPVEKLVSGIYALEEINMAIKDFAEKNPVRVLLKMGE